MELFYFITPKKKSILCGLAIAILAASHWTFASAQELQLDLGDKIKNIKAWETAIRERRGQQIEAALRRSKEVGKDISNNGLPNQQPVALLEPWVFQSTLQRRAMENDWPEAYKTQVKKIQNQGDQPNKVIWFAAVGKAYASDAEVRQKVNWLSHLTLNLEEKIKRAEKLTGVQKQILVKDIRHQANLAERIVCTLANCAWPKSETGSEILQSPIQPKLPEKIEIPQVSQNDGGGNNVSPEREKQKLKLMTGFASGIFNQIALHQGRLAFVSTAMDANNKIKAAIIAAGDGKAGGGGVTLHSPANIEGGLNPADVAQAIVADGRLVLEMRDGGRVRMPYLPLDDLAVALRTIYGPSGILEGILEAVDDNAIIFKTGPEVFGDVVWRKSYLPKSWGAKKIGDKIGLAIAPAVGILPLPEPSTSRITYYGDIKSTRIGQVISEADQLLNLFLSGVNPKTGKLSSLANVQGFMSSLEVQARSRAGMIKLSPWKEAPKLDHKDLYGNSWWRGGTFFVWVPRAVRFKYVPNKKQIIPVDVAMKLASWTANPRGPHPSESWLSDFVSNNYEQLAVHYPVINKLNNVLMTVSLVRWLKINNIAVDLQWVNNRKLKAAETPERIKNVWTSLIMGSDNMPIFRVSQVLK